MLAFALSYIRAETALTPVRLYRVLRTGGEDVLGVAATTATAGIIVGVVTLTGLGLKLAGVIVTLAGGTLALTVVYSAIAVWLLGLAVPVTASYIIAAVMVAPALVRSGVPDFAAHMFIFYYAVLSEVSPPTALSPFAAAALRGNPFRTMILTWSYTLPAFVVPFVFTLRAEGKGLLLHGPWSSVLLSTFTATAGITASRRPSAAGSGDRWALAQECPWPPPASCSCMAARFPAQSAWYGWGWCSSCTTRDIRHGLRPSRPGKFNIKRSLRAQLGRRDGRFQGAEHFSA